MAYPGRLAWFAIRNLDLGLFLRSIASYRNDCSSLVSGPDARRTTKWRVGTEFWTKNSVSHG
jgi:hypothetical protein